MQAEGQSLVWPQISQCHMAGLPQTSPNTLASQLGLQQCISTHNL